MDFYYVLDVCVGTHVIDRRVYLDKREAIRSARTLSREMVWNLKDDRVYYGPVDINLNQHPISC